jgi:hypothetical protein
MNTLRPFQAYKSSFCTIYRADDASLAYVISCEYQDSVRTSQETLRLHGNHRPVNAAVGIV